MDLVEKYLKEADPYGIKIKYDESKMKRLIKSDNFLKNAKKKWGYSNEVLFNSFVLGDSVMERKYMNS